LELVTADILLHLECAQLEIPAPRPLRPLNGELTIFSGRQNFIKMQSICKCGAAKITNKLQPPTLSLSFLGAERESGEMAFMLSRQRAEDGLKKKKPLRRQNENEDDQTALLSYFVIR